MKGPNVIDAPFERDRIVDAVGRAISDAFRVSLKDCVNPYGDGQSAPRILDVLAATPVDDRLLIKRTTV